MEKILLVEDNKSMAKLISMKITAALPFEVDVAYSLKEAGLFSRQNKYFIALLDLNLPDAPNGEIVDFMLKQNVPSIVLSGNINREFRREMLKKNIIDYVGKSGMEDIDYIISMIKRLQKNTKHRVLVVDDSLVFRKQIQKMLENLFFQVSAVAHGEEALGMLKEIPGTKLVLTDYAMPVMDGLELTKEIRKKYSKDEMSIMAISSNEDEEVSAMFLKAGATDFIKKPFSKEEFSCRINNTIEALENIEKITNHANRDFMTGLYNRRYFFRTLPTYFDLAISEDEPFAIAVLDIDDFTELNATHGSEIGDNIITHLSELLQRSTKEYDMVARFEGAEFAIVLKDVSNQKALEVFETIRKKVEMNPLRLGSNVINFTISIGINIHPEDTLDDSVNSADLHLYNAKNKGKNCLVFE